MSVDSPSLPLEPPTRTPPDALPLRIADHELLRPIAAGSYGEVWLARSAVGTLRAVKLVRRDRFERMEEFEREFKGLQRFEPISRGHDGLVDILQIGRSDEGDWFYYVMELADGVGGSGVSEIGSRENSPDPSGYQPLTLRAHFRARGALPADEVIALGLALTAALAHLHGQGLVHRDIKPSNILFVGGVPKLADAGLVAAVNDARSLVGTVGYLAPEGPGSPRADLYALGKVLYEAAFGKNRQDFPQLPPDLASRPDHARLLELNAIIATACAHDPQQRYASTERMRADLELIQAGRSVKRQRAWRRNRSLAQRFGMVLGVSVVVSVGAYRLSIRQPQVPGTVRPHSAEFVWSTNDAANEEFLKGVRALQGSGDNARAVLDFESAIQKDPNFAEAYARLAWAHYSWADNTNFLSGVAAAEKAISLNPDLAYAHSLLATARASVLKWAEAERERALAVSLEPNSQEVLLESALNLACMGRPKDALRDLERARLANPSSVSKKREDFYWLVYAWCRQHERAIEILGPRPGGLGSYFANRQLALTYLAVGDFSSYMHFSRLAALVGAKDSDALNQEFAALDQAFKDGGEPSYWEQNLVFESAKQDRDHLMRMAAIHARLDQPLEAFRYLRRAMLETPVEFSFGFHTNPCFDALRSHGEYIAIKSELWQEN